MIKIYDNKKLEEYVDKYKINNLFSGDMKEHMTLYMWNKNEHICKEGEGLRRMFFLVDGKAKVYKNLENGKCLLLSFYNPFRIIGDIEFIKHNTADCSVQVIKDSYCIVMDFDIVRSKLIKDCKFLLYICEYLGEKLSNNSNNSSINLLYSLENRLASYIVAILNENNGEVKKFTFEGSYNEIAELLGTSYRHLNRTLNKLCKENIIKKNGKGYIINDFDKLIYLSGDLYK